MQLSHCQPCGFMVSESSLFGRGFSREGTGIYFYKKGTTEAKDANTLKTA